MEECSEYGIPMKVIRREQELIQSDLCDSIYDMTEGQMADYMAAGISGYYGEWALILSHISVLNVVKLKL